MDTKLLAIAAVAVMVTAGVGGYFLLTGDNDSEKRINIDVDLEVFGNADKDDRVSEADAVMVEKYIRAESENDQTTLDSLSGTMSVDFADANQDGKIDADDVKQIRAIVAGEAEYIWLLDGIQNVRKISTDIDAIGCEYFANTELCLILGLQDKISAVDYAPYQYRNFYFDEEKAKSVTAINNMSNPNYDEVNKADLDILLTFYTSNYEAKQEKIYDCDVLYLGLYNPDLTNTSKSAFVQGVLKAGYIFDKVERAQDYVNWLLNYRDQLMGIAGSISDSDKPTVLTATYGSAYFDPDGTNSTVTVYKPADPLGQAIELAGGHNVYYDINEKDITKASVYGATVSIDTVLGTNTEVDAIFLHMVRYTYGGSETSTPHHGYTTSDDAELKAAYEKIRGLTLVEDDMSVNLVAGEFRNGCSGGVLLGAYMGKIINPEQYSTVDPVKMMNEYISWMGVTGFDASKDGEFVYPGLTA